MENLIPNTWWTDTKQRTWVLTSIPMTAYKDERNILSFKPVGVVEMLEVGKAETVEQPYSVIQEYIQKGIFKQLIT